MAFYTGQPALNGWYDLSHYHSLSLLSSPFLLPLPALSSCLEMLAKEIFEEKLNFNLGAHEYPGVLLNVATPLLLVFSKKHNYSLYFCKLNELKVFALYSASSVI